jgi:hypothetical protein
LIDPRFERVALGSDPFVEVTLDLGTQLNELGNGEGT